MPKAEQAAPVEAPKVSPVKIEDAIKRHYGRPGCHVTARKIGDSCNYRVNVFPNHDNEQHRDGRMLASHFISAALNNGQVRITDNSSATPVISTEPIPQTTPVLQAERDET